MASEKPDLARAGTMEVTAQVEFWFVGLEGGGKGEMALKCDQADRPSQ